MGQPVGQHVGQHVGQPAGPAAYGLTRTSLVQISLRCVCRQTEAVWGPLRGVRSQSAVRGSIKQNSQ